MADTARFGKAQSHVVVVGAGWAGWGAAKALCEAGVRVTLIDGMADPTAVSYTHLTLPTKRIV